MRIFLLFVFMVFSIPAIANNLDPALAPEFQGIKDEVEFRALVNCLTETDNECVVPIIFIMSGSEDKWFSITGAEVPD
ncbi:MAG: hypothetical protein H7281_02430 [Bacteriovorax sp.]|nr:hypothetical protein [Bacteriovorax sp.]